MQFRAIHLIKEVTQNTKYMYDLLQEKSITHKNIRGGGGTILPKEIKELHDYGITRIYHPDDGRAYGITGDDK